MKNSERQKSLDCKKWLASKECGTDMSGEMPYCDHCLWQSEWLGCCADQKERESRCLCATAYNRLVRNQQKNRLQPDGK